MTSYIEKHRARKASILAAHSADTDAEAWHTRRLLGIGGSEVAAVLNLDALGHKTPLDIWRKKNGLDASNISNRFTLWGHKLEKTVADHFAEVTGMPVAVCTRHFSMKSAPWMVGNIDRAIMRDGKKWGVLECKTTAAWNDQKFNAEAAWYADGVFNPANESGITSKTDIPINYYLQCQHYMLVTGLHMCYLAVLIGGNDYRIFAIPFNESDVKFIYSRCSEFWCRNVLDNKQPEPTENDYIKSFLQTDAEIVADASAMESVRLYLAINAQIKELDEQKENVKKNIINAFGINSSMVLPNGAKVGTLKFTNRSIVDVDAMTPDEREIYNNLIAKYTIKKPSEARTLRITYKEANDAK